MTDNFYDIEEEAAEGQGRDHLFLWTIFILLLVGSAFASWLGSFYIFGHPEEARPYRVLQKLHKLDPPKRFEITAAPRGEFLTPQRLFERYSKFSPLQLHTENAQLLRDYIKNYRETKKLVPYVTGRFEIIQAYELQKNNFFTTGMVVVAGATDNAQIVIEHVYPTSPENVSKLQPLLQTGVDLKLERTRDLPAVIHVARTSDGRFQFTVMPLSYGEYALKNGVGTFSLEPPSQMNVAAGVPIIRGQAFLDAMQSFADFRRTRPRPTDTEEKSQEPELVRLDTFVPGSKVPETGAIPEVPSATPIPLSTPRVAGRATATPPRLAMNATPRPREATPLPLSPPVAVAVPAATPLPASASGVPLKPFIAAVPDRVMRANAVANWKLYPAGAQPAGRSVTAADAASLADRTDLGERVYLRGSFVVTASEDNWAILRTQDSANTMPKPGSGGVRVIVEYPGGIPPPPKGATFNRDEARGFQVQDVSRRPDGQINITVREITQPPQ